jgi:hypothetical protein
MESAAVDTAGRRLGPRALIPWVSGFALGVVACGLACWFLVLKPNRDIAEKSLALNPAGDARVSLLLLDYLREGDTPKAIDLLQMQLNGNIVAMGLNTGAIDGVTPLSLDESSSTYVQDTSERAATYFEKYPRTPSSDPAFAGGEQMIAKTLAVAAAAKAGKSGSTD